MDVLETMLPRIGIRYELQTRAGRTVGIVVKREGQVDVAVYEADDPDRATSVLHLDSDEADAVADILGAPRMAHRLADLSHEIPGLSSARVTIRPGSAVRRQGAGRGPCEDTDGLLRRRGGQGHRGRTGPGRARGLPRG